MSIFQSVQIKNFRGIKELEIENLRRINVLVGKNNCGKTSVLEAVFLLSGMSNRNLLAVLTNYRQLPFNNMEDFRDFYYDWNTQNTISLTGNYSEKNTGRVLKIKADTTTGILENNSMNESSIFNMINNNENQDIKKIKFSFFEGDLNEKNKDEYFIEFDLKNIVTKSIYKEKIKSVIVPTKDYFTHTPEMLQAMIIDKNEKLLIESLKEIDDRIADINVGPDQFIYVDIGYPKLKRINVLGDGAVHLTAILAKLYYVQNGVLLVDEIDTGLHYTALCNMWRVVLKATELFNVQLFATTHSDECVRALSEVLKEKYPENLEEAPACLLRIEAGEQKHRAVYYSPDVLETTLEHNFRYR